MPQKKKNVTVIFVSPQKAAFFTYENFRRKFSSCVNTNKMHLLGYLNDKALKCQVICNSPLNLKKKWYFSHFGMKYKKNQKNLLGLNSKMDYKGLFAYFQQLMLDGVHCSILQFRKDIVNGSISKGKKVVTGN